MRSHALSCSPFALGSDSTPIRRLVEPFHTNQTPRGAIPRAFPTVRPCPGVRWLRARRLDEPRWPSSPSRAVLMARLPDGHSRLIFLRPPSPASSYAYYFESMLEEIARACSDTRIRPSLTLVLTGPSGQIGDLGITAFY